MPISIPIQKQTESFGAHKGVLLKRENGEESVFLPFLRTLILVGLVKPKSSSAHGFCVTSKSWIALRASLALAWVVGSHAACQLCHQRRVFGFGLVVDVLQLKGVCHQVEQLVFVDVGKTSLGHNFLGRAHVLVFAICMQCDAATQR